MADTEAGEAVSMSSHNSNNSDIEVIGPEDLEDSPPPQEEQQEETVVEQEVVKIEEAVKEVSKGTLVPHSESYMFNINTV